MLFAGIDVGSLTAEAVIVESGKIRGSRIMNVLPNPVNSAKTVMGELLKDQGLDWKDLAYTVSTGYGRDKLQEVGLAQENLSEISCHGFGAYRMNPKVRTVIDIGGQDAKVIKVGKEGRLDNFVMNDKCAAGTGHFLEVMSRSLGVELEELGPMSRASKKPALMSNRCTIYVETEVIHYLQRGADKADIAAGINRAMAERVVALVRRVEPEREIMLTGGVAKNTAVRAELEKTFAVRMVEPSIDPQLIGAYGAASFAERNGAVR